MSTRRRGRVVLLGLLLAIGCSEKSSVNVGQDRGASPAGTVRIVFNLPGDDIGGEEHQALLDAVRAGIQAAGAGEIVSSGFGMGTMEMTVAIGGDDALPVIRRIIGEVSPAAAYRLERGAR